MRYLNLASPIQTMTNQENAMETLIELTEADLDQILGGTGESGVQLIEYRKRQDFCQCSAAVAQAVTPSPRRRLRL